MGGSVMWCAGGGLGSRRRAWGAPRPGKGEGDHRMQRGGVVDERWLQGRERCNDPGWGAQVSLSCVMQLSLCLLETLSGKAHVTFQNLLQETLENFF